MSNIITSNSSEVTMSSMDMVEFINSQRDPGERALRHDHFMAKVPKVLGDTSPKFLGVDQFKNGTGGKVTRQCYFFPKREACLMAMSYSYELQAKVFDRMTELEKKQASAPVVSSHVKDPRTQALIEALVAIDHVQQEQTRQATELANVQQTVAVLEARTQPDNEFFTVAGYAKMLGKNVDLTTAAGLGRRCTQISKQRGVMIGDVKDPRFGFVHTYHESVLQSVFNH